MPSSSVVIKLSGNRDAVTARMLGPAGTELTGRVVFPQDEGDPFLEVGHGFLLWNGQVVGTAELVTVEPDEDSTESKSWGRWQGRALFRRARGGP